MALDKFVPTTPEQEGPKEKAIELSDKEKDVIAKQKQFANKLAQNKAPVVQQFLKTWYQVNVEVKKAYKTMEKEHFFGDNYGTPLNRQLETGNDFSRVFLTETDKNSETGKTGIRTSKGPLHGLHDFGVIPNAEFRDHIYSTSYIVDSTGVIGMKIAYTKFDYMDNTSGSGNHDHFVKKSGIVITVDINGDLEFYENPADKKYVLGTTAIEKDISKMKKLNLSPLNKANIMKDFTHTRQKRLQLENELARQTDRWVRERKTEEEYKVKLQKEKEDAKAVQSVKKVL